MTELVKGDTAKTETCKLGGNVVLPTTATVTIKTKLDGKVNIYYWNDETRKYTLLATPTAGDGKVTFATKQLGLLMMDDGFNYSVFRDFCKGRGDRTVSV